MSHLNIIPMYVYIHIQHTYTRHDIDMLWLHYTVWLKPPCHAHLSCQVHKLRGMHPVAVWCQNIAALTCAAAGGEDAVDALD